MKIGILTHPLMINYGGILQNYALQHYLRQFGFDAITVNRQPSFSHPFTFSNCLNFSKRIVEHYLWGKKRVNVCWNPNLPISRRKYEDISVLINSFISKNIQTTEPAFDFELKDKDSRWNFDAYVVGSDQVWQSGCCPMMFLDFVTRKNVIKTAYAASAGNSTWMDVEDIKNKCVILAKDFVSISARETNLAKKATDCLNRTVEQVLDPTMLLTKDDYITLLPAEPKPNNSIFAYILDMSNTKKDVISYASKTFSMSLISEFTIDTISKHDCLPAVEDWISNIYASKYVITDSFHGCVFSILFNKQFAVIVNKERGYERFLSLLSMFGLENRIVYDSSNILKILQEPIDYVDVNSILEDKRKCSESFLLDSLR